MRTKLLLVAAALSAITSCVKDGKPPELSGPSTFAKDLYLSVAPDILTQNGVDQAQVRVAAKSPTGTPIAGLTLRADILVGGVVQDFGRLSSKVRATDTDGTAVFTYTVPLPASGLVPVSSQVVQIAVTPVGSDFGGEFSRTVEILVIPQGTIGPSNPTLVASFTVVPNPPQAFSSAQFDASLSTNRGAPCGAACSYFWDFGDGTTGTGILTTHEYRTSGTKSARLTVIDTLGATATTTRTFTVSQSTPPTASFTLSPTGNITIGQDVFLNASASRPATGRTITSYSWDFGDRETGSGVTVSHRYRATGSFNIVLTVTDDAGAQTNSAATLVTVVSGNPTASFTVVTTTLGRGVPITFDASASSAVTGATIATYTWTWGDGTTAEVTTAPVLSHIYTISGPMAVVLTVTDSYGRTAVRTQQITIP